MKIKTIITELGNYSGRLFVWFAIIPLGWAGLAATIDLNERTRLIWILIPIILALCSYLWDKWKKRK
jgi:hypothetical protein